MKILRFANCNIFSNFATPKPKFCNPHQRQQIICAG